MVDWHDVIYKYVNVVADKYIKFYVRVSKTGQNIGVFLYPKVTSCETICMVITLLHSWQKYSFIRLKKIVEYSFIATDMYFDGLNSERVHLDDKVLI